MAQRKNRQWVFFAIMAPIMAISGTLIYMMGGSGGRLDIPATPMAWMCWGVAALCVVGAFVTWPNRDK